jgi:hypothetical protein
MRGAECDCAIVTGILRSALASFQDSRPDNSTQKTWGGSPLPAQATCRSVFVSKIVFPGFRRPSFRLRIPAEVVFKKMRNALSALAQGFVKFSTRRDDLLRERIH